MTTAVKTADQISAATLSLIPGGKTRQEPFIAATWIIAQSILWNHHHFTDAETGKFKKLIAEYYTDQQSPVLCFKDLVERICLAKRYLMRHKSRYVAKPVDWLNIHYGKGLAGIGSWLDKVKEQRKAVPTYEMGIATLAAALAEFVQHPDQFNFTSWRKKLIRQQQYGLLQLFSICMSNLKFLNYA